MQSILRETVKQINNNIQDSENQLVLTDLGSICTLMKLWHSDTILQENSLLPKNASDAEREAFNKINTSDMFDKLLMCACMLVEDGVSPDGIITLGTEAYPPRIDFGLGKRGGYCNPYDYSWFEEESKVTHMDCMDYVRQWYFADAKNREHFAKYYEVAAKTDMTPEMAWELIQEFWCY